MYDPVTFSAFTLLCNDYLYLVPKLFHHPAFSLLILVYVTTLEKGHFSAYLTALPGWPSPILMIHPCVYSAIVYQASAVQLAPCWVGTGVTEDTQVPAFRGLIIHWGI